MAVLRIELLFLWNSLDFRSVLSAVLLRVQSQAKVSSFVLYLWLSLRNSVLCGEDTEYRVLWSYSSNTGDYIFGHINLASFGSKISLFRHHQNTPATYFQRFFIFEVEWVLESLAMEAGELGNGCRGRTVGDIATCDLTWRYYSWKLYIWIRLANLWCTLLCCNLYLYSTDYFGNEYYYLYIPQEDKKRTSLTAGNGNQITFSFSYTHKDDKFALLAKSEEFSSQLNSMRIEFSREQYRATEGLKFNWMGLRVPHWRTRKTEYSLSFRTRQQEWSLF